MKTANTKNGQINGKIKGQIDGQLEDNEESFDGMTVVIPEGMEEEAAGDLARVRAFLSRPPKRISKTVSSDEFWREFDELYTALYDGIFDLNGKRLNMAIVGKIIGYGGTAISNWMARKTCPSASERIRVLDMFRKQARVFLKKLEDAGGDIDKIGEKKAGKGR